jgi:hypothetical protein
MFFPLIKIKHAKLGLKLMDLAQPRGLGFLAQSPSPKTQYRNRYKTLKIKHGFFAWISLKVVKNNAKNPKTWIFNLDHIMS